MSRVIIGSIVAAMIAFGAVAIGTAYASDDTGLVQLAAATCASFQNTCAVRCRKDNPQDKNCVSDHCSPKLAECRSTGCWQEGRRYGGGKTCNLNRG